MDIAQAKQELRRTIRAYTAKTEDGVYRMPRRMQRPVLLMGPPGIGKTAILSQLAQEEHIGLAAYTMTHHTRKPHLVRDHDHRDVVVSQLDHDIQHLLNQLRITL